MPAQIRVGEQAFDGPQVVLRQLAPQQGPEPGVGRGEARLELDGRAHIGFRLGHLPLFLVVTAQGEVDLGGVGLHAAGDQILLERLAGAAVLLKGPAETDAGLRLVRRGELEDPPPALDRPVGLVPLE